MVAKVLIHWPGLHHAQVDSALAEYACGSWGAELHAVVNGPGGHFEGAYQNLDQALRANTDCNPVYLVPESDLPPGQKLHRLHEFKHPLMAMYVVGADAGFGFDVPEEGTFLAIETPNGVNNSLWSFQVISILLYDRWAKGQ